jgi:hypothetical protein
VYTVKIAGTVYVQHCFQKKSSSGIATPKPDMDLVRERLRDAEIANVPFLAVLAGCSARRLECRVASHTSEKQQRNAPVSAVKNGILAFSASLKAALAHAGQ